MAVFYSRQDHRTGFSFQNLSQPFKIFVVLYLAIWITCPLIFYRDPSSIFFTPSKAYNLVYSAQRKQESNYFLQNAIHFREGLAKASSTENPYLCVGIPTRNRPGANYLNDAVGSLLDGLDDSERRLIHLILLIAHTDVSLHPSVTEGWPHRVADTVLTYQNLSNHEYSRIQMYERKAGAFMEKTVFDYTYLLDTCYETGAQYVAILEDDIIAMDGWFHRTQRALEQATKQTQKRNKAQYLYLRLFFTEKFLGWNSESWPKYLFYSLISTGIAYTTAIFINGISDRTTAPMKSKYTINLDRTILIYTVAYMGLILILLFAIGPLIWFSTSEGVKEMSNFGCCSQGLVFPRDRILEIAEYLRDNIHRPVDSLLEEYADKNNELRWAIIPSVLQHVGAYSSKADRNNAVTIFNFAFENNDPDALQTEHRRALAKSAKAS